MKTDLKKLYFDQIEALVKECEIAKFKAKSIWKWMYQKAVISIDDMTDLSKYDREKLSKIAYVSGHKVAAKASSSVDKSIKYLFELEDGEHIESVLIRGRDHNTVCVSSQVGCPQKCAFCATASLGYKRNLKINEIVEQVLAIKRDGHEVHYIVFMGMGEPLLNYDNVKTAINILNSTDGLGIGIRKITLSTCGVIPGIERMINDDIGVNLAVSLNAADNQTRTRLMPVNEKYAMGKLIEAAEVYQKKNGRRITFEYVMIKGVNDSEQDALNLVKILRNKICHVNLIALNYSDTIEPGLLPSNKLEKFFGILDNQSVSVTIRKSAGPDINGACGQLAGKS